jgi:hypothetical protein
MVQSWLSIKLYEIQHVNHLISPSSLFSTSLPFTTLIIILNHLAPVVFLPFFVEFINFHSIVLVPRIILDSLPTPFTLCIENSA